MIPTYVKKRALATARNLHTGKDYSDIWVSKKNGEEWRYRIRKINFIMLAIFLSKYDKHGKRTDDGIPECVWQGDVGAEVVEQQLSDIANKVFNR